MKMSRADRNPWLAKMTSLWNGSTFSAFKYMIGS